MCPPSRSPQWRCIAGEWCSSGRAAAVANQQQVSPLVEVRCCRQERPVPGSGPRILHHRCLLAAACWLAAFLADVPALRLSATFERFRLSASGAGAHALDLGNRTRTLRGQCSAVWRKHCRAGISKSAACHLGGSGRFVVHRPMSVASLFNAASCNQDSGTRHGIDLYQWPAGVPRRNPGPDGTAVMRHRRQSKQPTGPPEKAHGTGRLAKPRTSLFAPVATVAEPTKRPCICPATGRSKHRSNPMCTPQPKDPNAPSSHAWGLTHLRHRADGVQPSSAKYGPGHQRCTSTCPGQGSPPVARWSIWQGAAMKSRRYRLKQHGSALPASFDARWLGRIHWQCSMPPPGQGFCS